MSHGDTQTGFRLKRIYEEVGDGDGVRILVDRLWPRGVSKADAHLDQWRKDLAPSPSLRKWFNHTPERFFEFKQRYQAELLEASCQDEIEHLRSLAARGPVTLLYAAKDPVYNHAVVLKEVLEHGGA